MNEKEQLISKIKLCLAIAHKSQGTSRGNWTSIFKAELRKLGKDCNFKVYPDKDINNKEWLLDLCWSKEGPNWKFEFKGIVLACEIEWERNLDEIISDFQKLTVIDADIRLFIFQYDSDTEFNHFKNSIEDASAHFTQKGYEFIIAGSGNNDQEIKIFQLPGHLENI